MANIKDLATSTVATAPSPAASGTSLVVQAGHGTRFPASSFYAIVHADGVLPTLDNAEIVLVTAVSTDTFTITRTQKGTSARSIAIGDRISAAIFAEQVVPAGVINPFGGRSAPTGWLMCDGSAVSRSTYDSLFQSIVPSVGAFTVTVASPAVVTLNNHGFQTGAQVFLTTTGALPTGLSTNTLYYVIRVDANTFNLATSRANAYAGTKINTSGTQSGTHTLYACPYGLGDGSTTFNVPDFRGRVAAGDDAMGGTVASRLSGADATNGSYGNLGATGGEQTHQLTTAEIPSHTHGLLSVSINAGAVLGWQKTTNASYGTLQTDAAGGDGAHNNVQPTLVTNYIIKT